MVTKPRRRPWIRRVSVLVLLAAGSVLATVIPVTAGVTFPLDEDDQLAYADHILPSWFAELQDVTLVGTTAYLYGVGGLAIFDVSNPTAPVELGRYEPPGHPFNRFYRGDVSGTLAVGGGREDLLTILDVSNPLLPFPTAVHGIPGMSYEGAAFNGNLVYACRHGNGVEVVDVTVPALPSSVTAVTSLSNAWDITVTAGAAYVADGAGGLAVLDLADPSAPVHVSSLPTGGSALDVAADGNLAVTCNGSAGIDVFDISSPLAPVYRGTANTSGLAITAAIVGTRVYVADWDDVEIFDLGDPANPVPVGGEKSRVRSMGLDADNGLVVVADWSRVTLFTPGISAVGDIYVPFDSIFFGSVPVGATVDSVLTIGNTGSGPVNISQIAVFSPNFSVQPTGPLVLAAGQTLDLSVSFTHASAGYDATFLNIVSDDPDEPTVSTSVTADDNPGFLDIGETAPDFTLQDLGGAYHTLSGYQGLVVVLAFMANW